MLPSLVLALLAIPVIAVASLVLTLRMRARLTRAEQRLDTLQKWLADRADLEPSAEAPPAALPAPADTSAEEKTGTDEPVRPVAEPVPHPPAPTPPPVKAKASLEERFGTQWAVWAGGIALALGGFFLVRYSIEQGWFGPAQRVLLAGLVALALIGAGEWTRRREIKTGIVGLAKAHIPSVLTAAGTAIAYADVYAAYALYGFIGPAVAFVLLGIVALLTLTAALLHGPALAGLGLIGAFATPLIVATEAPNYWALYLYLAFVTAAAFALARAKLWRWLAIAAIAASVAWMLPAIGDLAALTPQAFYLAACFTLAALFIVSGLLFGPDAAPGEIDAVSSAALAAYLAASMLLVLATGHDTLALTLFVILVASTVAIAWRSDAAIAAVPAAALFVALIFWQWSIDFDVAALGLPNGPVPDSLWKPEHYLFGAPLVLGAALALLFGAAGFLAQARANRSLVAILWSATAVCAPLAILIALYWRIAGFDRSIPFAAAAVLLAGAFALATEALSKRSERTTGEGPVAIFATGAIASLALALSSCARERLAHHSARPDGSRHCLDRRETAVARATLARRRGRHRRDRPHRLGSAHRRRRDRRPARLQLAALRLRRPGGVVLRCRAHAAARGRRCAGPRGRCRLDPLCRAPRRVRSPARVERRPLRTRKRARRDRAQYLAAACHGHRTRTASLKSGSAVHNLGALILAGVILAMIASNLVIDANPILTGEPVGGRFINLVLLGYGIPALLAGALAVLTYGTRPYWYSVTAAATALALALGYISLEICRLYHGPVLTEGPTSDAEQYTYSAVWLLFGVALLGGGLWLRSLPLRIASAAVLVLTVLKVFLIDMSSLTGIYRALSFLGLGAVLIGIGWLYQRLLFPRAPAIGRSSAAD